MHAGCLLGRETPLRRPRKDTPSLDYLSKLMTKKIESLLTMDYNDLMYRRIASDAEYEGMGGKRLCARSTINIRNMHGLMHPWAAVAVTAS